MKQPMTKSELNKEQLEAVSHDGGPLLVLAGAGSGKTKIITERIHYLCKEKGYSINNILAVTFTNKAAREMRNRLSELMHIKPWEVWIGTFHSNCLRILKNEIEEIDGYKQGFAIVDESDQIKIIRSCITELDYSDQIFEPRTVVAQINSIKNKGGGPQDLGTDFYYTRLQNIYESYQQELRNSNSFDFSDLLSFTVALFESKPAVLNKYQNEFRHILVDEYQDTNHIQYRIVSLLSREHRNVFAVGDDNQSIYGWRGADIGNILEFNKDFPDSRIIKLEKNYRSTKNILNAANILIERNKSKHPKNLWTENETGELITLYSAHNEIDEARYIGDKIAELTETQGYDHSDIAVFYRTNNQSRALEDRFLNTGIPYQIVGGLSFYQRAEIKDVLSYLKLAANPDDEISLRRVINTPRRGIGTTTINKLETLASAHDISLFSSISHSIEQGLLSTRALKKLESFHKLINELQQAVPSSTIDDLLNLILEKTGYMDYIANDENRVDNIGELLNLAVEFEKEEGITGLDEFLGWTSLGIETPTDDEMGNVSLMTIHTAKGLEFPVVFITGLEENLFPHALSKNDDKEIEEERRLCYVAITRAKKRLFLTLAAKRKIFGSEQISLPSRFLRELPPELIQPEGMGIRTSYKQKPTRSPKKQSYTAHTALNSDSGPFSVGQHITHSKFGPGVVRKIDGSGDKAKVTVSFAEYGVKKIMAAYISPR